LEKLNKFLFSNQDTNDFDLLSNFFHLFESNINEVLGDISNYQFEAFGSLSKSISNRISDLLKILSPQLDSLSNYENLLKKYLGSDNGTDQ
jgi:hypothetical protein